MKFCITASWRPSLVHKNSNQFGLLDHFSWWYIMRVYFFIPKSQPRFYKLTWLNVRFFLTIVVVNFEPITMFGIFYPSRLSLTTLRVHSHERCVSHEKVVSAQLEKLIFKPSTCHGKQTHLLSYLNTFIVYSRPYLLLDSIRPMWYQTRTLNAIKKTNNNWIYRQIPSAFSLKVNVIITPSTFI